MNKQIFAMKYWYHTSPYVLWIHVLFNIVFIQGKQNYQQEQIKINLSINLLWLCKAGVYAESQRFLVGLYEKGVLPCYRNIFVCKVFHTCYLYLKKEEWNKTKKHALAAKFNFTTWEQTKHVISFKIWNH